MPHPSQQSRPGPHGGMKPKARRRNMLHGWIKRNVRHFTHPHPDWERGHCVICGEHTTYPLVRLLTTQGGRMVTRMLPCHPVTCIDELVSHAGSLDWAVVGPTGAGGSPSAGAARLAELAVLEGLVVPRTLLEAIYEFRVERIGKPETLIIRATPMGRGGIVVRIECHVHSNAISAPSSSFSVEVVFDCHEERFDRQDVGKLLSRIKKAFEESLAPMVSS